MRKFTTRDTILIGVLAAMCALCTSLKIPFGASMVHLGSAFVYLIGLTMGGVYAGLAAAIGSAFFDLLMGSSPYTLWSFVIKGGAGFIAGVVAMGVWPKPVFSTGGYFFARGLLACLLASLWTLGGYVLAWWQVTGSFAVALANIPSSLLTSGVGIVAALLLAPRIGRAVRRL